MRVIAAVLDGVKRKHACAARSGRR
jgi:hypothetical protein